MHLSQISLALTRLSGQFSPASLFAAGEVGAWYDPSDLTTLFTDSAGTTPVTAVEQFVGLMLDKSKGLVLGPELSNFNSASWTKPTGYAVNSSGVTYDGSGSQYSKAALPAVLTAGRSYRFTFTVNAISASSIFVGIGRDLIYLTSYGTTITSPGTYTYLLTAAAGDNCIIIQTNNGTQTFSINSLSVRELPGNHATSTGTKRPKLAARYNLLTYTEAFSNAVWGTGGAVAPTKSTTTGLNPNGVSATIDVITFPAVGAGQLSIIFQNSGQSLVNVNTTASVYARVQSGTGTIYVNVEDSGAAPSAGNFYASPAQTLTTTWQRLSISGTRTLSTNFSSIVIGFDTRAAAGQTNAAPLVVELWGADFRPTSQATGLIGPTYQRVVDAATYDTAGFLPYLQFDGIDDSMSTGSIDFTATDKMTVWAGVRKLSDAAAVLTELSPNYNAAGGGYIFNLDTGPIVAAATRDASNNYSLATFSDSAAPQTSVLATYISRGLSTNEIVFINKNAISQTLTRPVNQNTVGNFDNLPLFIGARNNASLYLNGLIYSLIVRGAQSTQSQIEATESWVNGRTGAF
jgi:hypothetical protein